MSNSLRRLHGHRLHAFGDLQILEGCVQHGRGALLESVVELALTLLVGQLVVTQIFGAVLADYTKIDVRARAQIVEDTRRDGVTHQQLAFFLGQVWLPAALKDRHGGQTARSHSGIRQFVGAAVRMDAVDMWSILVDATEHKSSANVSLVPEQHLLQYVVGTHNGHLSLRIESVKLQLR